MTRKPKRNGVVTAERFIAVWQKAKSPAEVMQKLGLTYFQVLNRASRFRFRGVPLKRFFPRASELNIPRLAALAKKHAPKDTP